MIMEGFDCNKTNRENILGACLVFPCYSLGAREKVGPTVVLVLAALAATWWFCSYLTNKAIAQQPTPTITTEQCDSS